MAVGGDIGGTRSLLCARITIVGRSSSQEEPWDLKGSGGHVGPSLALDIEYVNSSRVALVWLAGAKISGTLAKNSGGSRLGRSTSGCA